MFRALVYQRSALDEVQVADIGVVSANIKEDKTQKATSKIVCQKIPTSVGINDLLLIYNSKGIFTYWGIITGIDGKTLTCSQFEAFWNDNQMIVAQTSTNQKAFFNNSTISNIVKFYLNTKSLGYANIVNTMSSSYVPTYTGLRDTDVANNYKGVEYVVTDTNTDYMPFPTEKSVLNLESFLYDAYNTYNRIIRPHYVGDTSPITSDYTYLTYIQASGTQWINTNIIVKNIGGLNIDFINPTKSVNYARIFGTTLANKFEFRRQTSGDTDYYIRIDGTSNSISLSVGEHSFELRQSNMKAYVDGSQAFSYSYPTANESLWLFRGYDSYSDQAIKELKIYNKSNQLAYDFKPAIRKSDNAIGMHEVINDIFYENDGTGTFIAGEPISPTGEQRKLKVECFYPTGIVNGWDYNSKSLFDSWECISNLSIVKEEESTNSVYVYNNEGTTLRGAYTIKNDGTIVQIYGAVANRLGSNKTKFIYDTGNVVLDLVKNELPSLQYNHKISFNISFNGGYKFDDFNLGMPIKFYSTDDNHLYDSCLSAWEYSIKENSDDITSAKFTLGKVRKTLTSKLNRKND